MKPKKKKAMSKGKTKEPDFTVTPRLQEAFVRFLEYHPAKRLSVNLRSWLLEFLMHDAEHPHLHILVSRIGYDGKVMSDSNDFAKCGVILRRLEKKHGLAEVVSSKNAQKRAVTKNELEMVKRTKTPSNKMRMQSIIKDALNTNQKLTCLEFAYRLQSKGVNVVFNQASTGYVSGISYSFRGVTITGSKLGNDFKWASVKSAIDYDQQRDRRLIEEINKKGKSGDLPSSSTRQEFSEIQREAYRQLKQSFERSLFTIDQNNPFLQLMRAEEQPDISPEVVMRLKRRKRKGISR